MRPPARILTRPGLAAAAGIAVLVPVALLPPVAILDRAQETSGDVAHYERLAVLLGGGAVPYRDFAFEYPPAALVPIALPGLAGDRYQDAFRALMVATAAAGIALVAFVLGRVGAAPAHALASCVGIGLAPLALPDVFFDRYDLWPTVLLLAGLTALVAGRRIIAVAALAAGTVAKVFPGAAAPPAVLTGRPSRRAVARDGAVFCSIVASVLLAFVAVAPDGTAQAVSTLVRRPLHIESLGGSLLLAAHQLGLYEATVFVSFGGSQDLAGPLARAVALVNGLLAAAGVVLVWVLFARGERSYERALGAAAAAVVVLAALSKVLSPQFLVWIVFVVPLAARHVRGRALALAAAALVLTRAYYPFRYEELILLGDVAWVAVARNVVLVALAAVLVASLRPARAESRISGGRARAPARSGAGRA